MCKINSQQGICYMAEKLTQGLFINLGGGMGRELVGTFKREGIYVYLWLIQVEVWQKTTKFCKAIILQKKEKERQVLRRGESDFQNYHVIMFKCPISALPPKSQNI